MLVKGLASGEGAPSGAPVASAASGRRRVRHPRGQGSRLRSELIAAADRILAQTGDVAGLSLRAVAREVGIATPSIYLHFQDKRALVHAVLSARFAELAEAVQAAAAQAAGPAAQLQAGCLAYCRFATEHPNAYRVLFGVVRPAPDRPVPASTLTHLDGPSAHAGAAAFGFLVEGVAACMHAGLAPTDDPLRVATNVWTALHGIVTLRASLPAFPWPALDQQVHDALTGMVGLHHNPPPADG